MASNWSQGGQPYGHAPASVQQNNAYSHHAGPPPICFKCGVEGHFVAACPNTQQQHHAGSQISHVNHPGPGQNRVAQGAQWANYQHDGHVPNHQPYPRSNAVVTHYAVPNQAPIQPQTSQYGAPQPAYGAQPQYQQYQQYPQSAPPPQAYSQPLPPHQTYHLHVAPQPQLPPSQQFQPPRAYGPTPTPQHYGARPGPPQNYGMQNQQVPQFNQYPRSNAPYHTPAPSYQVPPPQYGPPVPRPPYQPPNIYQPQHGHPNGGYNYSTPPNTHHGPPPQWNTTPSNSAPYQTPPFQQRRNSTHSREPSLTPRYRSNSYQPQSQPQPDRRYSSEVHQQTPQTPSKVHDNIQQEATVTTSDSPASTEMPPQTPSTRSFSPATTPYARRGSITSSKDMGRGGSTTPTSRDRLSSTSGKQEKVRSDEDVEFNWALKHIFEDEPSHETVSIAQPLSTTFDVTPVPLLDPKKKNTVSRYARKENIKEFTQNIRKSPQWPYLQQDPVFKDLNAEAPLIPLRDVHKWMEERHGIDGASPSNRRASGTRRKRARSWTDQNDDFDNQDVSEVSQYPIEQQNKRQKVERTKPEEQVAEVAFARGGTLILGRSGTPCLAIEEDDAWAPQPGESLASDPTEALLASLGVSGKPKPVKPQSKPKTPFKDYRSPSQSNTSPSGSMPTYNSFNAKSSYGNQSNRQDSGYGSARTVNNKGFAMNHSTKQPASRRGSLNQQAFRRSSSLDNHLLSQNRSQVANNEEVSSSTSKEDSPLSPTSREILGQFIEPVEPVKRKIVRVISGKKNDSARQVDDVTPRYKRSQPVVAEAYSRRW